MADKSLKQLYDESEGKVFSIADSNGETLLFLIPDRFVAFEDKSEVPSDSSLFRGLIGYFPNNRSVSIYSSEHELSVCYDEGRVRNHDNLDIYMVLKDG